MRKSSKGLVEAIFKILTLSLLLVILLLTPAPNTVGSFIFGDYVPARTRDVFVSISQSSVILIILFTADYGFKLQIDARESDLESASTVFDEIECLFKIRVLRLSRIPMVTFLLVSSQILLGKLLYSGLWFEPNYELLAGTYTPVPLIAVVGTALVGYYSEFFGPT